MVTRLEEIKREKYIFAGALAGACIGPVMGAITTAIGGYEIGTAINNHIGLVNHLGRGTLDAAVTVPLLLPGTALGRYIGTRIGIIISMITQAGANKINQSRNYSQRNERQNISSNN